MSKAKNWDDKSFVLEQIQKNIYALKYASDRLKDDFDVVLATVSQNGAAFALKQYGFALEFASDRLKDNEAIVLAAVNQHGRSLEYASSRLKDNEEVVLSAVQNIGYSLRFASDRLRSDVSFCIECAKKNPRSIAYFLEEVKDLFEKYQNNLEIIQSVYTEKQQTKANEALLKKISTGRISVPTNKLFKRKLLDV